MKKLNKKQIKEIIKNYDELESFKNTDVLHNENNVLILNFGKYGSDIVTFVNYNNEWLETWVGGEPLETDNAELSEIIENADNLMYDLMEKLDLQ